MGNGTVLIQPYFSEKSQRLDYNLYYQYQFDLVFRYNGQDKELFAVIVSDYIDDFAKTKSTIYTAQNTYQFLGSVLQDSDNHNAGLLPFVAVHVKAPSTDQDYIDPAYDLVLGNLQLNLMMSDCLHLVSSQAHGILVYKKPGDFTNVGDVEGATSTGQTVSKLGPDSLLEIPINEQGHQPSLEYVSQNQNFDQVINAIQFFLKSFSQGRGLPPDTLSVNVQMGVTATEVAVKESRTRAATQTQTQIFAEAEEELFTVGLALVADIPSVKLPADLSTKNFRLEFIQSVNLGNNITMQDALLALDKNVIDRIEVLRKINPSLSREEAFIALVTQSEDAKKLRELTGQDTTEVIQPIVEPNRGQ